MRTRARWLAAVAALGVMIAGVVTPTGPAQAESNGGVRVMPLGDSITEGTQVPGGYRIGLWQRLASGRYTVDFVGSQFNGPASLGDHDHQGHPGWRIDQIDANIVGWLNTQRPQTVLLHIGTNDILQNYNVSTAPNRLSTLIDRITATVPTAEVFVAQLIPLSNSNQEAAVRTFNAAIPGIVSSKVSAGKRVRLVDMHSAITTADLIDGIHPTAGGYDKMAARWYSALQSVPGSIGNPGQQWRADHRDRGHPVRPVRRRARFRRHQRAPGAALGLPRRHQPAVDLHLRPGADRPGHQVPGRGGLRHHPGHRRSPPTTATAAPTSSGTSTPTAPSPACSPASAWTPPARAPPTARKLVLWTCTGQANQQWSRR